MSDQLNFKQVPFDTMYYNNLTKHGGQVLIDCDPNRTVLKIIEACITKNNTVLSDAELALWIFRYHIQRTKNHVELVKLCATYLREFFQFGGYFERFMAKIQQHDYDKFQGNEHVASFAVNAPLYKYKDLYEISNEAKRVYEEIEWVKHHMLNDHHPENYMRRPDPEKEAWVITDEELKDAYKEKGGHPAILMALGEMVADWSAVGIEMGDTATDWWLKNKDVRWSYGPKYTQALEACLMFAPKKLYVKNIEPIPAPPKLKLSATHQAGEETTSAEVLTVSTEGWFDPVKEEGTHYTIRNFPVLRFFNKLRKEYKTSKLEHLFEVIGIRLFSANSRTIVIHKFFVPELLYLLNKYEFPSSLINTIRNNTWVGASTPVTSSVDLSYINKMVDVKLYEHQTEFLKNYVTNKVTNHLRGYLLSFEQGLGKTITALCLMEGLKKEHTVIICPKNTMMETWNAHLIKFFKDTQSVWVAGYTKGPLTTSAKWIIVNYERIDEIKEFLIKNQMNNLGIIVDESHNFLRTSSQRTQLLIDLAKYNQSADILMMSGTPIKCVGNELLPIMQVLDPYCDEEAITIFKRTFGFNTSIANDVLNARLDRMMTRVKKDILDLPEKKETTINIKMPTGWKYTASQVEKQIVTFVKERQDYYNQNLQSYLDAFEEVIEWLQDEPTVGGQPDFQRYLNIIDWLRESSISDARGNTDIVWANQYEKDVLIPALPEDLRKQFIWSKSVVKYLPLKIKGEVIGQLLTRLRMQMTTEMLQAADIKQYVDNSMKKTVVFTSYVDTIEVAYDYFKANGYNVAAVYGKTASELTATVKRFQEDQSVNPLIASLKMISTGATLTAANTVIFLNKPWRSIEYQQASDRVHRIGQDTECEIISLVLDTGKEANLSTRMEDIMQWSNDQFDQIVDKKERELVQHLFKSFASLEIPEDCESDIAEESSSTTSQITLRELDPSNRTEVKYVTDTADLIDDDPEDYEKWTPDDVKKGLKKGHQFFLLLHGSEVVGSIGVMFYKDNTVDLFNLGIFPKYQGKGYGRQSVSATIQYVLKHNPSTTEIYICAYKTNQKVCHLYESMGFKIVETREKMYLMVLKTDALKWSTEVATPYADTSFTKKWTYGKYVKDDTLYRCMNIDVPVLTPHQDIDGQEPDPSVNLTPSIAMALMFGTPRSVLFKGTYSNLKIHFGTYIDMENFYDPISVAKYRTNMPNVDRTFKQKVYLYRVSYSKYKDKLYATAFSNGSAGECCTNIPVHYESKQEIILTVKVKTDPEMVKKYGPAIKVSDEMSTEQLGSSMEASTTLSKIAQKKKKILDYICKLCDTMEPSGLNSKRYRQIIGQMNDKEFDQFMNYMKEGKWQLHLVAPNMIVNLQNEDLLNACDLIGLDLFQRIWMYDRATGRKFLTDNKYMFVKLPIRRQQQFLDEKISVPDNDRTIDGLTGQVTGDSRSCSITNPEIQILAARGLDKTMQELVNIRGGNIHGYSEFRRMLEENGEADLEMIDPNSRTRASVVGSKLLQSMMLDTNL